jgi:amino acid adenylation domain-containing protein/non-ribosomal peptide synthase protein (TIGR01720 family)
MSNQAHTFPTSFAQQRLWILDQLVPGNPFYNIFSMLPLRVENVAVLERALNEIVKRHETLRTTFSTSDGQPVQVISAALKLTIPVVDLRDMPPSQCLAAVQKLTQEEASRPFDLARGPLVRATLVKRPDADSLLLLTIHHIISDGWSMRLFFRELVTFYQSLLTGRPASLSKLTLQYADFAVWQRDWLKGEVLDRQLDYWRQQLEGVPFLRLPLDRPRPTIKSYGGARLPVHLPDELVRPLRSLCQSEGVTMFMLLLAAFQLLLSRYSGQDDVAVGSPIAGRNRGEIENLIGFFVNTLVMRTDLSGDPTFRELLQRVRNMASAAYAHQDLPFEMLVESLQPDRDLSRNPLFQVIFQLLNNPSFAGASPSWEPAPATLPAVETHSGTAKFDLEFSLFEDAQGLLGHFEYSTELFDESTIVRVAGHFETLLRSVVANPDTNISRLSFLTDAERTKVVFGWNETAREYPRDVCVHTLFEQQVKQVPGAIAIVDGEKTWTYRELDRRANIFANRLRQLGAGRNSLVAICMERSAQMIAAMLAVLKSGAAYVPLDPEYPRARLGFMLADTEARVLMTERRFAERLPKHSTQVMYLDGAEEWIDDEAGCPGSPELTASDLAYVMYTSGSTGRPKGVCIPHRAINRLILNTDYVQLEASDCLGHIASPSFDAATFEIWGALLTGARIAVIPREVTLSPVEFGEEIRRQGVTAMFLTSALFNQMVSENPRMFQSMRHLLVGGSAVDPNWTREVLEQGGPGRLLNGYGPTESTTFAAVYHITDVPEGATTIPIGRPIANTQLYVLDPNLEPVPVGVPGELYIGGDGLAKGYLKRDALTAEKFVPHPFAADPKARLYKTGDLVRWRATGDIEFIGRTDEQVKVRGFRVELGEIEADLGQHPAVQDAVVVARADAHGDKRLVAYVVPKVAADGANGADVSRIAQDQVGNWREIFDGHVYREFAENGDSTFNITGWNSSYTGEPLPVDDMREWLDDTVDRITAFAPQRILEIGCGTGLLLFRLAENCSTYCATDFSATALGYIQQVMNQPGRLLPQVQLLQRTADDFSNIEPGSFDLVVLNSVVQYFPSAQYLQRVLEGAVRAVRPGGQVFIGDVRSLPLLQALHTSIEFSRADDATSTEQLQERIQAGMAHETELVVDPRFFTSMPERVAEVRHVEVLPKRGRKRNELTRFRYQVVLHVGPAPPAVCHSDWIDWREERLDAGALRQLLEHEQPPLLGLTRVANARLSIESNVVELLDRDDPPSDIGELRELASREERAIDPHDLWMLERELPYRVEVSWSRHRSDGRFDVLFIYTGNDGGGPQKYFNVCFPGDVGARKEISPFTNNPLRRDVARKLVPQLRAFLQERLPEFMVPSAFVVLSSLSLTPNGKVNRKALPAPDRTRPDLEETYVAAVGETEQILTRIWSEVLGLDRVGVRDNFFELGGDSILSIQIIARARKFGLQLTPQDIFQHQTIADLGAVVRTLISTDSEQGLVVGELPLTPVQRWLFEQNLKEPHHFNQATLLKVSTATDAELMRDTVGYLIRHHDALRLRFRKVEDEWTQFNADDSAGIPFREIDLRRLTFADQATAIENESARVQARLNLAEGPLLFVVLFRLGAERRDRLLIVVHHLAIDGVSWRVMMEDLQTCYEQLGRCEPVELPAKTTSFKRWAQCLMQYAGSVPATQELSFWLQRPMQTFELPLDHERGANTVASARNLEVALTPEETRALLQDVPSAYRTQVNDALLAALGRTLANWTGHTSLLFDLEGHGREDLFEGIDLSRTVGWFTSIFPVSLSINPGKRSSETLKSVKEQLRRIPNRGIGYGVLRYLTADLSIKQRLSALPQAQLCFNYLGQFDNTASSPEESAVDEPIGLSRGPLDERSYLLEINARVEAGSLRINWTYSENRHYHETILQLAKDFVAELRALVTECSSVAQSSYAPSDFPDLAISQDELDQLVGRAGNAEVEDLYQLSPMQEVMLFQTLFAPNSGAYLEQLSFPCSEPFNVVAFRQAWEQAAQLYSVLRTAFFWEDLDQPLQMVLKQAELPWVEKDISGLPAEAQEQTLRDYLEDDRRRGFDLSRAPLLRFAWFRLSATEHRCICSFHHLILDGWSVQTVFQTVAKFYTALCTNRVDAQEVVRPFGDYIKWLRRQDPAEAASFWRRQLAGIAAPTPFNIDRAAVVSQTAEHFLAAEDIAVSALTTARLKNICREHSLTLNTLLVGVWALLLSRYSNEKDVLFGTVVSGRPAELSGIESMVGMFINSLPLHIHVDPRAALIDWLKEIQALQLEMRRYEYSHPLQIQEVSDIPGGTQMFESVLVFENFPVAKTQENANEESAVHEQSNLPLSIMVVPRSEIQIRILYSCDRFDAPTVRRILGHMNTALEAMATNADCTLDEISVLTLAERRQLLKDWNDTEQAIPPDENLIAVFETQCERTPDAIALQSEATSVTYAELNARSNCLARHLQTLGVGREVLVGVCMERSPEFFVAILATLKAGGAYLPLDPSYPHERLEFMLQDAKVSVVLTQKRFARELTAESRQLLCLDDDTARFEKYPKSNLPTRILSDQLAYVIYTSGSTGKPKGALGLHGATLNRFNWMWQKYPFAAGEVCCQKTSLGFVDSIWETLGPLLQGVPVVIVPDKVVKDCELFISSLCANRISRLVLVPSLLEVMMEQPDLAGRLPDLRYCVCSGEQLAAELVVKFKERLPRARLLNLYGSSEVAADVTCHEVLESVSAAGIPIGRPIANTQIYVLDPNLHPVPIGVPGELFVGGLPLARGYLNCSELTAEKFIPDPFSNKPGARLYRTGDLARFLPDGNIEYVGRLDNQVKIRGYRVELGEIETVLAEHPGVSQAVVIAHESHALGKSLVTYLVAASKPGPDPAELRRFLKSRLPEYMVPAIFIGLDAIPLTANGKINRQLLPRPDEAGSNPERIIVAARNATERVLVGIWSKILSRNVEQISMDDDFFADLGGHSLLATQLVSRIRTALKVELPLRRLFEIPTIEALAQEINDAQASDVETTPEIQRLSREPVAAAASEMA